MIHHGISIRVKKQNNEVHQNRISVSLHLHLRLILQFSFLLTLKCDNISILLCKFLPVSLFLCFVFFIVNYNHKPNVINFYLSPLKISFCSFVALFSFSVLLLESNTLCVRMHFYLLYHIFVLTVSSYAVFHYPKNVFFFSENSHHKKYLQSILCEMH